jgi:hypothetical protein
VGFQAFQTERSSVPPQGVGVFEGRKSSLISVQILNIQILIRFQSILINSEFPPERLLCHNLPFGSLFNFDQTCRSLAKNVLKLVINIAAMYSFLVKKKNHKYVNYAFNRLLQED